MLARFLTRRVEGWEILIVALLGLIGMLLTALVVGHVMAGGQRFGPLTPMIRNIATAPRTLKDLAAEIANPSHALLAIDQRFEGQSGFTFAYAPGSRPEALYLMLNRYDGEIGRSVSELVDMNSQETVHRWVYEVDATWADSDFDSDIVALARDNHTARFRATSIPCRTPTAKSSPTV